MRATLLVLNLLPHAKEVWGKVIFLHLSVIHSVHGGWSGICLWVLGVCLQHPSCIHPPLEMAIEAGGMHPTGIHSCSFCLYKNIAQSKPSRATLMFSDLVVQTNCQIRVTKETRVRSKFILSALTKNQIIVMSDRT